MRLVDYWRPRSVWQWLAGIALACLVWLVLVPLWDRHQAARIGSIYDLIDERGQRRDMQLQRLQQSVNALVLTLARIEELEQQQIDLKRTAPRPGR